MPRPSRRQVLQGAAVLTAAAALPGLTPGVTTATPRQQMPAIQPRTAWTDQPPLRPMEVEAPEDVRFLLVHHSASGNGYAAEDVPGILRSFHGFHTSATKGWPDIAYNFLVDRHGGIWEGRAGSLDAPVKGDATGGSQGFAVLACMIGDLEEAPPTDAAVASLTALLAWLADRYEIDPRGQTSFTSRGSNRHPAGSTVQTATIAAHREMSQTSCPGRFGVELVAGLPPRVAAGMPTGPTHYRRPAHDA